MKILFVNNVLGYEGGLEQYIHGVSKLLFLKGHQNIFLYSGSLQRDDKKFSQYFLKTYQIPFSNINKCNRARLKEIVINERPDIAYVHKVPNPDLIKEIHNLVPTIRMIHDHEPYCLSARKYHYFSEKICERKVGFHCYLYPGCYQIRKNNFFKIDHGNLRKTCDELDATNALEKIIVASNFMKQQLISNGYNEGKVDVVPLFVNPSNLSHNSDQKIKCKVIYIGQLNRSKGLDLLLKSLKLVNRDYNLIVMGDGKSKAKYKLLANKLGIASRIKFTGWISHEEMENYYEQAAMLVMPSRWPEPFGLVGLEAMAHGVPVVAFNVGGIPDWLEDGKNGFLVERGNIRQLAEKIKLLLTDKNLNRQLGEYSRQCVMTKYNADDYVKKLLFIFEQAIQKRRGA